MHHISIIYTNKNTDRYLHTVWTVNDFPSKIAPCQNNPSAHFVKSKIASHLRGYFGFIYGVTSKDAPNSFRNSLAPPKNEGLFWISQNLQRSYFGKGEGLFWEGANLERKSLTVQTRGRYFAKKVQKCPRG